eukprot:scaffold3667_cov180-Amphora_coffeaeformis.AAC.17
MILELFFVVLGPRVVVVRWVVAVDRFSSAGLSFTLVLGGVSMLCEWSRVKTKTPQLLGCLLDCWTKIIHGMKGGMVGNS